MNWIVVIRSALVGLLLVTAWSGVRAQEAQHAESVAAAAQVFLDRAGFSPGSIDGKPSGVRTRGALLTFQKLYSLRRTGDIDEETLRALEEASGIGYPFKDYRITEQDAAGPWHPKASGWAELAKVQRPGYTSIEELLAEKFHVTEQFLRELNPGKRLVAGEWIRVPDVEPFEAPGVGSKGDVDGPKTGKKIEVLTSEKYLRVLDANDRILFHAPITPGSSENPAPSGIYKINGIAKNPDYMFTAGRFSDAKYDKDALIAPGPNNPVGVVWINLTRKGYGLHGTPEPRNIGYTASHGCIRMTNWDVMRVAALVKYGVTVDFK